MGRGEPGYLCGSFSLPQPTSGQIQVSDIPSCHLERRADGAVVVRVHSRQNDGRVLPDAVFAFRAGDPQYSYWDDLLRSREILPTPIASLPIPLPTYEPS